MPEWLSSEIAPFTGSERWLGALCEHLVSDARVDTLELDGTAALRMPLCTRRHVLALPVHDHLSLSDVRPRAGLTSEDLTRTLDERLAQGGALSAFEAMRVPDHSLLVQAAREGIERDADKRWALRQVTATAWFELDGATSPVPGKLRRNLKRLGRELSERGQVEAELIDASDTATLRAAFEEFLTLESAGWKGADTPQASTAIADDPALLAFYRALIEEQPGDCTPIVALLRLDGRPIAAQLGLRCGPVLSLLKIAYDEREGRASPGSQLLIALLELASDDGVKRLSLVTSPAWAERWHPQQAPVWHVTRYADSLQGTAWRQTQVIRRRAITAWRRRSLKNNRTTA